MTPAGFPHSEICGSMPACGSPQLFAADRVLLRRMVPGHPPCALVSLIFSSILLRPIFSCPMICIIKLNRNDYSFDLVFSLICSCQGARAVALDPLPVPATCFFRSWFRVELGSARFLQRTLKTIQSEQEERCQPWDLSVLSFPSLLAKRRSTLE